MAVLLATKLPGLVENVRHSRKAQNKMTGPWIITKKSEIVV